MQTYNGLQLSGFPQQQGAVFLYRATGNSIKKTAALAGIAEPTAKRHASAIFKKYGVNRMSGAVTEAFKRGHLKYIPILLVCLCSIFGGDHQARRTQTQRPQVVTVRTRESFV